MAAIVKCVFVNDLTAKGAVNYLVGQSAWFEFTPLPDGEYEVAVKNEGRLLAGLRLIALAGPALDKVL